MTSMKRSFFFTAMALGGALSTFADVSYTCDTTSLIAGGAPANICSMLNGAQVSGVYSGIFSNMTANIYIQFAGSGLANSNAALDSLSYNTYLAALQAESNSTAVQSLAASEPALYNGDGLAITSALAAALGLATLNAGIQADGTDCTLGASGCYNGVITIGASASPIYFPPTPGSPTSAGWDFYSLVEHETDEILGTISCIATDSGAPVNGCTDTHGNGFVSPADLFRYSGGSLSFLNTANGQVAYFSTDGGITPVNFYNNSPNGEDYGDWSTACFVQSASACQSVNMDIATDGGSEITALNAVGFNTVPEPGSIWMLGASLAVIAYLGASKGLTRGRRTR